MQAKAPYMHSLFIMQSNTVTRRHSYDFVGVWVYHRSEANNFGLIGGLSTKKHEAGAQAGCIPMGSPAFHPRQPCSVHHASTTLIAVHSTAKETEQNRWTDWPGR